jgi:hypothetical protein
MDMRIYFIDGPAAGRSADNHRTPVRLRWDDGETYRRVRYFRSTTFYRHVRGS